MLTSRWWPNASPPWRPCGGILRSSAVSLRELGLGEFSKVLLPAGSTPATSALSSSSFSPSSTTAAFASRASPCIACTSTGALSMSAFSPRASATSAASSFRESRAVSSEAVLSTEPNKEEEEEEERGEGEEKASTSQENGAIESKGEHRKDLHVVLVEPLIPGNVGSIARTCAATCVGLHLIEPLGFQIDDAKLKRAGLDYWPFVVVKVHRNWDEFFDFFQQQDNPKRLIAFSKRGSQVHWSVKYQPGDWLLFGSETSGLLPEALEQCKHGMYAGGIARIPLIETHVRSLNLAVAASVGVYEALRQIESAEDEIGHSP